MLPRPAGPRPSASSADRFSGLHKRTAPELTLSFGPPARWNGDPIVWSNHTATSGHMAIAGPSGTGKTFQIRRLATELARQGARQIVIIDKHGDLDVEGAHSVRFSEQSRYGLPPLNLHADPDSGGVRRRATAFIRLLHRQGALGARQKTALFRLLVGLYARHGFDMNDPSTWSLRPDPRTGHPKRYPTLTDLREHLYQRLVMLKTGQTLPAVLKLQEVLKLANKRHRLRKQRAQSANSDDEIARLDAALGKAREDAAEAFREGLELVDSGTELQELIFWDNAEAVQGLFDRVEALERARIFSGEPPPFDAATRICRYDIYSLPEAEQQLLVDVLLEHIFHSAKAQGLANATDTFIIVDEANLFIDDEPDSIMNRIANEGRKFGIGLILASQSFVHYSDDLLTSSAVKLVLGCPEMHLEPMRRRLGLEMVTLKKGPTNPLRLIRPTETAMVSISTVKENRPMIDVHIARA